MQRITHKRIRISWLLLLVYLPMLLAVTFHHHGEAQVTHADFYCADCAHHVHHDGHLTALQNTMHDCVLCQLQSTPYLAPSLVVGLPSPCSISPLAVPSALLACAGRRG